MPKLKKIYFITQIRLKTKIFFHFST